MSVWNGDLGQMEVWENLRMGLSRLQRSGHMASPPSPTAPESAKVQEKKVARPYSVWQYLNDHRDLPPVIGSVFTPHSNSPNRYCPLCDVRWYSTNRASNTCWVCGENGPPM